MPTATRTDAKVRKGSRMQSEVAGARGMTQHIHDHLLPEVQPRPHSEPNNLLAHDDSVAWAARPMTEAKRPESGVAMATASNENTTLKNAAGR